ncbi:MAG: hypothetical protein ACRD47_14365, partial [Nitrososphaeraceae archaeon]
EAGIGSSSGKILSSGAVHRIADEDIDSGLALVNTSSEAAELFVLLLPESGQSIRVKIQLGPGEHRAKFLGEIFPEVLQGDFQGNIRVSSDRAIALVVIRTKDGLPISSLPVGSTER